MAVKAATRLEMSSAPPYSVSRDFGQLAGIRHFTSGVDWAMAGAATAVAVAPRPATPTPLRDLRLAISVIPFSLSSKAFLPAISLFKMADCDSHANSPSRHEHV